jgi:hypothetical protein
MTEPFLALGPLGRELALTPSPAAPFGLLRT